jgi:hypothetical protein
MYWHANCCSGNPGDPKLDHTSNGIDFYCQRCGKTIDGLEVEEAIWQAPTVNCSCGKPAKHLGVVFSNGVATRLSNMDCDACAKVLNPDPRKLPDKEGWCWCTGKKHVLNGIHCTKEST